MAITLGNKTKLTTEFEKLLIELGEGDPTHTLTNNELSAVLVNAIEQLAEHNSPILLKLYRHMEKQGAVSPLSELDEGESSIPCAE